MQRIIAIFCLLLGVQALIVNANSNYLNENYYCQFEGGPICNDVPHVACPSSAVSWNKIIDVYRK